MLTMPGVLTNELVPGTASALEPVANLSPLSTWALGSLCLQGLAISTFQVVLVPTVLGVLTNELAPGFVRALKPVLPLIGVALTTLLCASPCAQVASILKCALAFWLDPTKPLADCQGMPCLAQRVLGCCVRRPVCRMQAAVAVRHSVAMRSLCLCSCYCD